MAVRAEYQDAAFALYVVDLIGRRIRCRSVAPADGAGVYFKDRLVSCLQDTEFLEPVAVAFAVSLSAVVKYPVDGFLPCCNGYGIGSYSKNAFVSGADEKALAKSVLVCRSKDAHSYELCTETGSKGSEPVFTQLNLGITDAMRDEVSELNRLPEYKYNGDDPAIGAICEYLAGEYSRENYAAGRNVAIPAPTIYRQEKVSGELLVFGYFWTDTYCKNGNTLISVSGGALPGCFHLVKDGDTYKIASIDAAEDGERYEESIKKMTEGFPGLYEMYFAGDSIDEKVRKEAINDYVLSNGLGIDYYKDYGWDPVALN